MKWWLVVALWIASAAVAGAHAYIVATQPAMNGSYPSLNGSIGISFDEPITIFNSDALEVTDDSGRRVDRRDAHVDPADATRVVVDVPQQLASGFYTVHWRVISADTHVVHGSYQIGVGIQLNAIKRTHEASAFDPATVLPSAIRWLSLLGALLAAGALALQWPVLRKLGSLEAEAIARRAAIAGVVLVLAVAIPALFVQAAAVSGHLGGAIGPTLQSRWGIAWIVRLASAVALLLIVALARRRAAILGIIFACMVLASFSASGHALALHGSAQTAAFWMDFAHLLASSVWIGGVLVLAPIVLTHRALAPPLFARFTPLAMASVGAILVSGVYAAVIHIPSFADLVHTNYGRILLAKVALVAVLLGFGYRHMRIGRGRASDAGANTIGYEALVGIAIIALTAFLIGQMLPMHMAGM